MELPSYSKQLLQQLYTLCKEQQFCDCTIFIGTVHFRAHKVVLAAASVLFKSFSDTPSVCGICFGSCINMAMTDTRDPKTDFLSPWWRLAVEHLLCSALQAVHQQCHRW
uniref:BTB domain-containing protein n=1 Tax=Anser cygnoides TaxID=8845 RepID=A0A8B9DWG2_ANSCY